MKKILVLILLLTLLTGCQVQGEESIDESTTNEEVINEIDNDNETEEPVVEQPNTTEEDPEEITEEPQEEIIEEQEEPIDLEAIQPNELGQVMVVMYHSLIDKPGTYNESPERFKRMLKVLYEQDYRLVSLTDYVTGEIDLEAGYTPIVFTFDDGHISNFEIVEKDGELTIAEDSAVGILESFVAKHPDFGNATTFFINGYTPFGQEEYIDYKMNYLINNGYDIGNHTYNHVYLNEISGEKIEEEMATIVQLVQSYVPDYKVQHLALPYGIKPVESNLDQMISGNYEGTTYQNISALKVGWRPEYSAYNNQFDYTAINRVQSGSGDFQLDYWLEYFKNNPEKKYISDGNSNHISFPKALEDQLDQTTVGEKEVITY
jgi:peptidoglycan/xylan/chitin deacetylase (PgdA/CDA1 family)